MTKILEMAPVSMLGARPTRRLTPALATGPDCSTLIPERQRSRPAMIPSSSPATSSPSPQERHNSPSARAFARKTFRIDNPELYERIRLSVQKACPAWLSHESDDLTQKAMIRLMERAKKEDAHEGFCATYIYRAAHNTVIDEVRKRRREVLVQDPEPAMNADRSVATPVAPTPSDHLRDGRLRQAIFHCLGKIRAERRIAISMKLQGHSTIDIARLLDWNCKRVENMTSRGRQDLRVCLQKKGITGTCHS